jgi:hypothetical protein
VQHRAVFEGHVGCVQASLGFSWDTAGTRCFRAVCVGSMPSVISGGLGSWWHSGVASSCQPAGGRSLQGCGTAESQPVGFPCSPCGGLMVFTVPCLLFSASSRIKPNARRQIQPEIGTATFPILLATAGVPRTESWLGPANHKLTTGLGSVAWHR